MKERKKSESSFNLMTHCHGGLLCVPRNTHRMNTIQNIGRMQEVIPLDTITVDRRSAVKFQQFLLIAFLPMLKLFLALPWFPDPRPLLLIQSLIADWRCWALYSYEGALWQQSKASKSAFQTFVFLYAFNKPSYSGIFKDWDNHPCIRVGRCRTVDLGGASPLGWSLQSGSVKKAARRKRCFTQWQLSWATAASAAPARTTLCSQGFGTMLSTAVKKS